MNKFLQFVRLLRSQKLLHDCYGRLTEVPRCGELQIVYERYRGVVENSVSLDIGCGSNINNPFLATHVYGVDIRADESRNIKFADLFVDQIPFSDNTFDYLTAFDFIEHVPRVIYSPSLRFAFVELMNEVYRVLKIGGIFLSHTPVFPFPASFQDPTHVNMITEDTFPKYFGDSRGLASMYGFRGAFKIETQLLSPPYLISVLRKL